MRSLLVVTCAVAGLLWLGCGGSTPPAHCEWEGSHTLATPRGSCPQVLPDEPFGSPAGCQEQAARCSEADRGVLAGMAECFEALPACAPESSEAFLTAAEGCYARAAQLSADCLQAYYAGEVPTRAQAAPPDAGLPYDTDGSGALDVTAVADETSVVVAWSLQGRGEVAEWEVLEETDAGTRVRVGTAPAHQRFFFQQGLQTGTTRRLFVAGLTAEGTLATTEVGGEVPDAGEPPAQEDGGSGSTCTFHLQCPEDQVCQDGACAARACTGDAQCPGGYACGGDTCQRGEAPDGGLDETPDAGQPQQARPILSELVEVTTAVPAWTPSRQVTAFSTSSVPVAVAMDVARQAVALVQEGRPYVHLTEDRGRSWTIRSLDTQGSHVRLAWQPSNEMLFACYTLGTGVRVRRSVDAGRSWDTLHMVDLDVLLPEFGGPPEPNVVMSECAIAPWSEGRVLVVVLEGEVLVARVLAPDLTVVSRTVVYDPSIEARLFSPHSLQLATLAEENVAHLVFVGMRLTGSSTTDTDIYGTRVEPGMGGTWASPSFVSPAGNLRKGSPHPESYPSLTIDPVSKRAVAAFQVYEPDVNDVMVNNVYLSTFVLSDPANKRWAPSGELDVFDFDLTTRQFRVMTERKDDNSVWEAFAPTVVATGSGQVSLLFAAGPTVVGQPTRFLPYAVGVDLAARNGFAWYLPPARQLSTTLRPVVRMRPPYLEGGLAGAADALLSTHAFLTEGSGEAAATPEATVQLSRP